MRFKTKIVILCVVLSLCASFAFVLLRSVSDKDKEEEATGLRVVDVAPGTDWGPVITVNEN